MSQRNKKIIRTLQKHVLKIQEQVRFKTSHITQGWRIIFLGGILVFFSLFSSWISAQESIVASSNIKIQSVSSFSSLIGFVGIFILATLIVIFFSVFSLRKKEKFHFFSLIQLSDYICSFYGALFIIILCIQSFLFIGGLQIFSGNIYYGKWIILCMTWAIVILFASFILKKEYRKNSKWTYYSELRGEENQRNTDEVKNNMKLPF